MRYQRKSFSCGAAAVVNALRALGKRVKEATVRVNAGTCEESGTPEEGILAAVRAEGFSAVKFQVEYSNLAWDWIITCLENSEAVVLCVSNWQHWVTAVGLLGNTEFKGAPRIVIVDPTNAKLNKSENGVWVLSKREFMKKWRHSQKGLYSGISVKKT